MSNDKIERNYVADAYNWEQRIKGENESARVRSFVIGYFYKHFMFHPLTCCKYVPISMD